MSEPNQTRILLDYLESTDGSLSKRLPIAGYVRVRPTLRGLLQKLLTKSFSLVKDCTNTVLRVIVARCLYCFLVCRVATVASFLAEPNLSGTF